MDEELHPNRLEALPGPARFRHKEVMAEMLGWAIAFLLIAIVAAVFGFGGIAAASAGIAKALFFLFLVVFLVTLVFGVARRT